MVLIIKILKFVIIVKIGWYEKMQAVKSMGRRFEKEDENMTELLFIE